MIKEKSNKLGRGMLPVIFSLAWPTMLEQLMQTAVQYIDTAMVGSLGTQATAAVGATSTVNWLMGGTISAIGIGFLAYIAKACGAGDEKLAGRASAQAVLITLLTGLFFTALTLSLSGVIPMWMQVDVSVRAVASRYFFIIYTPMLMRTASIVFGTLLRAAGDTKTPMRVGIALNILNVLLNILLIYPTQTVSIFGISFIRPGAGLGIEGAAIASAIAFTVGGIAITAALWRHPVVSPRGHSLKPDKTVLLPCMKVAVPNMLQRFATALGYVVFASMINSLGEISTAAHTIANTVESAFYIPGYGMQTAAATLAGNALGARDNKKMRELGIVIIRIEVVLMLISGALLFFFAQDMMRIFAKDSEVIRLGGTVLKMVALSEPFYGVSIIIEGMLLGTGNTMRPFVYSVIGMWAIRIAGTFICTQLPGMTLISAWSCMILHNLTLFVLYLVYYLSGKWNPLLRQGSEKEQKSLYN